MTGDSLSLSPQIFVVCEYEYPTMSTQGPKWSSYPACSFKYCFKTTANNVDSGDFKWILECLLALHDTTTVYGDLPALEGHHQNRRRLSSLCVGTDRFHACVFTEKMDTANELGDPQNMLR
jgi:hypothetical protein